MSTNYIKKKRQIKTKLTPLKISNLHTNNFSESKKDEINHDNSSKSILNSIRYLTTFDESSFESMRVHIIKKPYKIFQPIKEKMKIIRNNRELSLNNYYKKTLKNDLFLKDIIKSECNSKKNFKIPKLSYSILKSTLDASKSNLNNISKNVGFLSTERTSTSIDLSNFNLSNISNIRNYDKYKIFSYNSKKNLINNNNNNNNNNIYDKNDISDARNDYKILRFLNLNQGYKNLPTLKTCVKNFTNEITNLTKEKYINYYLKEQEQTVKGKKEFNSDNYKLEIRKKLNNKNLLELFYRDYNTYYMQLKKKKKKIMIKLIY